MSAAAPASAHDAPAHAPALALSDHIGYGIGDFGINLFFIASMTYLTYFYTDVMGLTAAAVAMVMVVARLTDAVTDPLMGLIAERTRSRWGRMRPYLLFGPPVLAVLGVLTFHVPDGNRLAWAYLTYIGFGIAYTIVGIPYSTITASLTTSQHERTVLSTFRMACAFIGGYVVSVGMLPLVGQFESEAQGFRGAMVIFGIAATLVLWVTFASVRERVPYPVARRVTVAESLRAVFRNPPLIVVMVLFTCGMLGFTIRQAVAVYYFKYNVGDAALVGQFFGVTLPVMIVGLAGVPWLAKRCGKAGAIIAGAALGIVGCVGLYFTPYNQVGWIFFWGSVVALGGTPIAVLGWAMIPDTVEYAQWKHGVRADGAIYSLSSFFQKLAKMVGGAGVAAGLAWAGYVANAPQSAESTQAIHQMMTLAPLGVMVVMIVAALLYPLNSAAHQRMVEELGLAGKTSPVSERGTQPGR